MSKELIWTRVSELWDEFEKKVRSELSHQSIKEEQVSGMEWRTGNREQYIHEEEKKLFDKYFTQPEERLRWSDRKKEKDRDWEIVAYKEKTETPAKDYFCIYEKQSNGLFCPKGNKFNTFEEEYFTNPYYPTKREHIQIHSVKRLSDNEVFTVGDEVECTEAGDSYKKQKIEKFIKADDGHIRVSCAGVGCSIQHIQKLSTQPTKERTEVTFLSEFAVLSGGTQHHVFWATKEITKDKFPLLKAAIEAVLNGGGVVINPGENVYTKSQADEIEEAAFLAGRKCKVGYMITTEHIYPSYYDYKKSK